MTDDELQRFYERAAHDEAFREALWNDPDGTIDSTDLPTHVKAMLKSVTPEQLAAMVRKATGTKPRLGTIGKVALGVGAVAIGAAFLLAPSLGATRETALETSAMSTLRQISLAEQQYKAQYGTFGAIGDLARFDDSRELIERVRRDDFPYAFTITLDDDTFTATALHRTRPHTRKAFIVGPDGAVKELRPDDPAEQ